MRLGGSEVEQLISSPAAGMEPTGWEPTVPEHGGLRCTVDLTERNPSRSRADQNAI